MVVQRDDTFWLSKMLALPSVVAKGDKRKNSIAFPLDHIVLPPQQSLPPQQIIPALR